MGPSFLQDKTFFRKPQRRLSQGGAAVRNASSRALGAEVKIGASETNRLIDSSASGRSVSESPAFQEPENAMKAGVGLLKKCSTARFCN